MTIIWKEWYGVAGNWKLTFCLLWTHFFPSPFLVFRIICHCYLLSSLTLWEIVTGFQEEETQIQFDMTLIPPAKNCIVSLSPFPRKLTENWALDCIHPCMVSGRWQSKKKTLLKRMLVNQSRHLQYILKGVRLEKGLISGFLISPFGQILQNAGVSFSDNKWQVKLMSLDLKFFFYIYIISKEK